jgi:cysteinyl-tRNA synthetase
MVEGQKMAKSLGNFYTLRDLLEKGWTGREVRYALLTVNYRLPLNFTFDGLAAARAALGRIDEWTERLAEYAGPHTPEPSALSTARDKFFGALDDDLNISGAMGHLFVLIRDANAAMDARTLTQAQAAQLLADWQKMNSVLVLERDALVIPAEVTLLVEQRQQARAAKNWGESDRLRDEIGARGWVVKDTKDGPKLTLANR